MEIDLFVIGLAAGWGGLLGVAFFGGLWWSLQGISHRRHPRYFLGYSFLVRSAVALGGFWMALHHSLQAFLASVGAFTITRFFLTHWLGEIKGSSGHVD